MNLNEPTHTFNILGTTYHCRALPADCQNTSQHIEEKPAHRQKLKRVYFASVCGRILSASVDGSQPRVLKSWSKGGTGSDAKRQRIKLHINGTPITKSVSRLIARTFLTGFGASDANGNTRNECNHIDGNPANNAVSNLHWCSQQENAEHFNEWMPAWEAEREAAEEVTA